MRTNPCHPDADGDGVDDFTETAQGSDPNDASDGGVPGSRAPVSFTFGDHSGSHSEKYTLSVTPVSGSGSRPSSFRWLNENYGVCETKTAYLKPGWRYAVRLDHSGTKEGLPTDYDYTLRQTGTLPSNVIITDDQSLFGVDNTSSSFAGAGKVAYVDVLKFEFMTPAGDPVSSPNATAGVGQNEFTYDDGTSSLSLSLQVKVWPQLPSGWASRTGTFYLSVIEGATLEWEGESNGNVTASGNIFTARATYRGYPTRNSGFGRKTANFALGDMTVSQDFEVFFPSSGTHHPTCMSCQNCPNWFYYWKDGGVCGISSDIRFSPSGTELCGEFAPIQNAILLHSGAPLQTSKVNGRIYEWVVVTNHLPSVVIGEIEIPGDVVLVSNRVCTGVFPVGVDGAGIRAVAAALKHERRHQDIFQTLSTIYELSGGVQIIIDEDNVDVDEDRVLDTDEVVGRWGLVTDVGCSDTFEMWRISASYESYGDNEIRARLAEEQGIDNAYFPEKDWCNPGCNSKIKRGPLIDESE